jgi:hypothetical protein
MATISARFNPNPAPPNLSPFDLTNDSGGPPNLITVAEGSEVSISISLADEGASFPGSESIIWGLQPDSPVIPTPSGDNKTLTFTVPAPAHPLLPWVFRLIVNVEDIGGVPDQNLQGVRSQNFYVATPMAEATLEIDYDPADGIISLGGDGADLASTLVMVNTQLFGSDSPVTLNISDPAIAQFQPPAIYWGGQAEPPAWISGYTPPTSLTSSLSFTVDPSGVGQGVGIQFLLVTAAGLTILSPDPILINATIGDG